MLKNFAKIQKTVAAIGVSCLLSLAGISVHAAEQGFDHKSVAGQLVRCGTGMLTYVEVIGPFEDQSGKSWNKQTVNLQVDTLFLNPGVTFYLYNLLGEPIGANTIVDQATGQALTKFSDDEAAKESSRWIEIFGKGGGEDVFGPFWETCMALSGVAEGEFSKIVR